MSSNWVSSVERCVDERAGEMWACVSAGEEVVGVVEADGECLGSLLCCGVREETEDEVFEGDRVKLWAEVVQVEGEWGKQGVVVCEGDGKEVFVRRGAVVRVETVVNWESGWRETFVLVVETAHRRGRCLLGQLVDGNLVLEELLTFGHGLAEDAALSDGPTVYVQQSSGVFISRRSRRGKWKRRFFECRIERMLGGGVVLAVVSLPFLQSSLPRPPRLHLRRCLGDSLV